VTTISLTIERPGPTDPDESVELTVEVRGTVSRYRPATRFDPEEGGDVEIESVTLDGVNFELDAGEEAEAEEELARQAREDAEEARDRDADEWRDRQMERDWL
jgi:hypothetical protein